MFRSLIQPCSREVRILLQCRRSASTSVAIQSFRDPSQQVCEQRTNTRYSQFSNIGRRRASSAARAIAKPATTKVLSKAPLRAPATPQNVPNPKLNLPPETYAPTLSIPTRQPSQNYASYLWSCGRAYIQFYKTGIANVRWTARLAKNLRSKAAASPDREQILTRAEWQIIRRSRRDMLRLPAFAGLVLLLGEWLPLVVIWLTPVVPEACRIPRQVERDLVKLEQRRREGERRLEWTKRGLKEVKNARDLEVRHVDVLTRSNIWLVSTQLDAHSKIWDVLKLTPPSVVLRWGVRRKLGYLRRDDAAIRRDGGWQGLGEQELKRACIERGIYVLGKDESALRTKLAKWYGTAIANGGKS